MFDATSLTETDSAGNLLTTVRFVRPSAGDVLVLVHESLVRPGRINIEIDGDFTGEYDELTVHVNDRSVACFTDAPDDGDDDHAEYTPEQAERLARDLAGG